MSYTPTIPEPPILDRMPGDPAKMQWYAAYTCARHEKSVSRQLQEKCIDCFLPLYRSVSRWKDRRKELMLPLFPGYVFVHITSEDRLRVLQIPSVAYFVSCSGRPATIEDSEMQSIRQGVSLGACVEPHPYLKIGKRVRVKHGPLSGTGGVLVRRKDGYRVVLSIDLIQRSVAVEVGEADLERL